MTGPVLNKIVFALQISGFSINMIGFLLNMSRCPKYD